MVERALASIVANLAILPQIAINLKREVLTKAAAKATERKATT